ncbi:membrane protein [Mycolicibacterium conceptionense]|uniref:Membrane protein n=3 Tax=Mycolicibacterium TaxID=1866885 RepID=A0ABR5G069_9MYCO|nr:MULTISPECIES: alpha/beta hydrolase-fold protein [Mycolicibacterium]KLI06325.1 membrane protein [Mycolicibacterium senegalense]KLO53603.1 membrane protein [Mycolicibacterium senegalense]KMV19888.1 membrane protein [Mycolicibacterium conceptionense]
MTTTLTAADQVPAAYRGVSLLHGWLPPTLWALAAVALIVAIGWRTRRWRTIFLPCAIAVGVCLTVWARWFVHSQGLAGDPAPAALWIWIGLTGLAIAVLALGWRGSRWRRRAVSVAAVPLCLLSVGVAVNLWVGYFPTVTALWNEVTAGPLPDQTDLATALGQRRRGEIPSHGELVSVTIPSDRSGFKHRDELVYLPPAWFAPSAPRFPVVMMIAGEFNTPADWARSGNAIATIDNYAADHGGNTPVFVFVDVGGSFNNDTECVNGPRGNVADHLTKDVPPYMTDTFGVRDAGWGVLGWSMGGTCAVDLTVMHPELFSSFVDIAGDTGPNAGTKDQTVARLYGGDAASWATYDPATAIGRHGAYQGVSGWFVISSDAPVKHGTHPANPDAVGLGGQDAGGNPGDQTEAAHTLCDLGRSHGIRCAITALPGKHDWPFAEQVLTTTLPWLAGAVGTPEVPPVPLPSGGAPPPAPTAAAPR